MAYLYVLCVYFIVSCPVLSITTSSFLFYVGEVNRGVDRKTHHRGVDKVRSHEARGKIQETPHSEHRTNQVKAAPNRANVVVAARSAASGGVYPPN